MQAVNFEEVLETIVAKDRRYHREAYLFVREALDYTQKSVLKGRKGSRPVEVRHVTGQQLLGGIREYGLQQYGPMTLLLLREWGVTRGEDFGEIVFNMVEAGLLGKTERDSRDDFKNSFDFTDAFQKPFLPAPAAIPPSSVKGPD